MDIYDFVGLLTDDSIIINIWDLDRQKVVWTGEASEAKWCDYAGCEVMSFDYLHTTPYSDEPKLEVNIEDASDCESTDEEED